MHACMHTNSHTYITLQYMAWHYITLQYIHTNFHTIRVHMHAEIQAGAHIKIKDKLDFTLHYSRARLHCLALAQPMVLDLENMIWAGGCVVQR